jgi:hypothetical protein
MSRMVSSGQILNLNRRELRRAEADDALVGGARNLGNREGRGLELPMGLGELPRLVNHKPEESHNNAHLGGDDQTRAQRHGPDPKTPGSA